MFRRVWAVVERLGGLLLVTLRRLREKGLSGLLHTVMVGLRIRNTVKRMDAWKPLNPDKVSGVAKQRGAPQLGSLGSGNHFLEIERVDKIFDQPVAEKLGIRKEGQVLVLVHTGSRGFGYQVCSDYLRVMEHAIQKYGIKLPDRQLACAPAKSNEVEDYIGAMSCAANFAWSNRQMITHWTRESFEKTFGKSADQLDMGLTMMWHTTLRRLRNIRSKWNEKSVCSQEGEQLGRFRQGTSHTARVPGHRAASPHPREHGNSIMGSHRGTEVNGAQLRDNCTWSG